MTVKTKFPLERRPSLPARASMAQRSLWTKGAAGVVKLDAASLTDRVDKPIDPLSGRRGPGRCPSGRSATVRPGPRNRDSGPSASVHGGGCRRGIAEQKSGDDDRLRPSKMGSETLSNMGGDFTSPSPFVRESVLSRSTATASISLGRRGFRAGRRARDEGTGCVSAQERPRFGNLSVGKKFQPALGRCLRLPLQERVANRPANQCSDNADQCQRNRQMGERLACQGPVGTANLPQGHQRHADRGRRQQKEQRPDERQQRRGPQQQRHHRGGAHLAVLRVVDKFRRSLQGKLPARRERSRPVPNERIGSVRRLYGRFISGTSSP